MKLLVVGGGGREHAIIKSLKKNPQVTEIFAAPGNGGIANDATCVAIGATEIEKTIFPSDTTVILHCPLSIVNFLIAHRQGAALFGLSPEVNS